MEMGPAAFFGLSSYEITTVDSGYAYIFSALGLPFCVALWAAFVLMPAPNLEAQRCKMLLGVYIAALLCISGTSLFALKTAGLGFFILGALATPRAAPVATLSALRTAGSAQGAPA
jgi:putative polymerase